MSIPGAAALLAVLAVQTPAAVQPIPAEPPIGGMLWSIVVPALLLIVSTTATIALYRRFRTKEP